MSRRAADGRTPRRAADRRALDRRALHYDGHAPVTVVRVGPPGHFVLMCFLSSPPPPILHSHKPVIAGNGRGTGNGHSPLHSIVHSSINSMRVCLSDVPLRGPPWSAVRRGPPPAVSCPACIAVLSTHNNSCVCVLRYALAVMCPRARRAYGTASTRMGITGA
jgi:hypothetical protein